MPKDNGNARRHIKTYKEHSAKGGFHATSRRGDYYARIGKEEGEYKDRNPGYHSRNESRYKPTGEETWGSVIGYTGDTIGLFKIKKLMSRQAVTLLIVLLALCWFFSRHVQFHEMFYQPSYANTLQRNS